jgi:hypothetical protein
MARRRRRITPLRRDRWCWYRWREILTIPGIGDSPSAPAHPRTDIDEIVEARRAGHTLQEIGDRHHLTRERVRQILARAAQRFGHPVSRACLGCGTIVTGARGRAGLCADCARRRARKRTCRQCGTQFPVRNGAHTYCPDCQTETRPCAACGQPIVRDRTRQNATFRNRQWFCDRRCFGRWVALTYGFLAHPEHVGRGKGPRLTPILWRYSGYIALALPISVAARLDTGRVRVMADHATITILAARRRETGPNIRSVSRSRSRAQTAALLLHRLIRDFPWARPGMTFDIAEAHRHRVVLRPILPNDVPTVPGGKNKGAS